MACSIKTPKHFTTIRKSFRNLTIIALTMSLLLFFKARTAFARDTLACDMTSSMSLTSTPVSSTYKNKGFVISHDKTECAYLCVHLRLNITASYLFFFALLLYCWRLCVFLDVWYSFSLYLEFFCGSQLGLLGKIFDLEHRISKMRNQYNIIWQTNLTKQ